MFGKITLWGILAISSLLIPGAAVMVWKDYWWPHILFVMWTIAAVFVLSALEKRKHREQRDQLLHHAQVTAIRTLSHHRHDWMNELQILYGYLRLNKPDKAVEVVDRIRERMDHDSKLSHIGIPELATYLLSFRTVCDTMRLDVEVADELYLDRLPYNLEKLSRTIIGLINVIRFRAASSGCDNVLRLSFRRRGEELALDMVYSGELAAADSVNADLEQCLEGIGMLAAETKPSEKPQQTRAMTVHFPLPAINRDNNSVGA